MAILAIATHHSEKNLSKFKQVLITLGIPLLVVTGLSALVLFFLQNADLRDVKETIPVESIETAAKETYGYELLEEAKGKEIPVKSNDEHYKETWYLFKTPNGKESTCRVDYLKEPDLKEIDGISSTLPLLKASAETETTQGATVYQAQLVCDGKNTIPKEL